MNWAYRQRKANPEPRRTSAEALALLDSCTFQNKKFTQPFISKQSENISANKENFSQNLKTEENTGSNDQKVFKILWAKPSGRKKRIWEGDGQLVIEKNTFTLYDEENRSLGTGSAPPDHRLSIGSIFTLGSKEIEVLEELQAGNSQCTKKKILDSKPLIDNIKNKKFKPNTLTFTPSLCKTAKSFSRKTAEPLVLPPPPCDYQWAENKKSITPVNVDAFLTSVLRPHQREGLVFLYECVMGYRQLYNGAILADEMGLGKSLQSIALIWTLLKHGPYGVTVVRKVLVIAPSTLCGTWEKEFLKWLGRERLQPFLIDNNKKPKDFNAQNISPVMIISYERFVKSADEIDQMNFQLIVCDEAHRLKNSNNKAAQKLQKMFCKKRILLTGTPVQNDLHEYYVLADVANPGILGKYSDFKSQFEDPILNSQKPDCTETERRRGEEKAARLNTITSSFILRRSQNVLENILPLKTEYVICCRLTPVQKRIYSTLISEWWNNPTIVTSPLSFIIFLKKICNHPMLLNGKDNTGEDYSHILNVLGDLSNMLNNASSENSSKIIVLKKLLKNIIANNEKVVIVSSSTQVLDIIENECKSIDASFARLDGNTPVQQRQRLVDNFNRKGSSNVATDVFLLSARAGGVGLSLPGASRLILFDSDWNPAIDNQAMARIWRDGQRKPVHIYRFLTTGTIEEKIYQRQIYKTGLSDAVLDSDSGKSTLKLHDHELKDLFTLAFDSESSTHDMIECSCRGDGSHDDVIEESEEAMVQKSNSNISSINQLKTWDHFRSEFNPTLLEESCLEGTSDIVSFIFRKYYKQGVDELEK